MSLSLELMIAFRYLKAKRREGFISVIAIFSFIGIMLGVATLIVVMAVMQGFRSEITKKILGFNGHINISSLGAERGIRDYDNLIKKVKTVEGITEAVPLIAGQVMASNGVNATGAAVQGISFNDLKKKKLIIDNIKAGKINFADDNQVVIGTQLAQSLALRVGDEIKLISPSGNATILGTMPRIKTFIVGALFEAGMYEYDSSVIFMPLNSAQVFFRYPNSVSTIEVMTNNPDNSQIISGYLINSLPQIYYIQDWQMLNASLFNALKVERTVMFLILTLIVFIAAFNIISSLIMLVNDKRKYIAVLRTMGATKGMILRIFFYCGSLIGISGTFAGFLLGVGFASNIETIKKFIESLTGNKLFDPVLYFLSELPAEIQTYDVARAVLMGVVLSFLATIYPAYKASRQEPVEVLRYE